VAAECNECNEALDAVRGALDAACRLANVADNAIVNGDLQRARAALLDLRDTVAAATTLGGHPKPARDGHRKTGQLM
jgi:hypothetical protein